MLKFACTQKELSCIIGNLFIQLEPPCNSCDEEEQIIICGTTYTENRAVLSIRKDGFYYDGDPDDISRIRERRCVGGAKRQ